MAIKVLPKLVEYVYDPSTVFQPGHMDYNGEKGEFASLPPQKANKKYSQQKAYVYNHAPQELSQEKILAKIIPGFDGRERVFKTTSWPHTIHVQLTMHFNREVYGGSGVMVGPHHLLTCGHNVYDTKEKKWAESITVFPALNDDHAPFGQVKVVKVYIYTNWTMQADKKFDIALLILNQSIGKYTGWGGVVCIDDQHILQEKIHITGYPGDKGLKQMWSMSHVVKSNGTEEFEYEIDTHAGQSGSGIWINKWGLPLVLGVHTLGGDAKNFGVRISEQKFTDLFVTAMTATRKLKKSTIVLNSLALSSTSSDGASDVKQRRLPLNRAGRGKALVEAATLGNLNEVEQLLGMDTDVNAKNPDGETALIRACENGHESIVEMLTENGAELDIGRKDGDRALEIATKKGFTGIVRHLVREGAKLVKEIEKHESYYGGSNLHIRKCCPALASAAATGNLELVQLFLDRGVNINENEGSDMGSSGGNALLAACKNGHELVVRLLLERKVNVQIGYQGHDGTRNLICHQALSAAYYNGHKKLTHWLLQEGFDIDSVSSKSGSGRTTTHGESLLFYACQTGDLETLALLLKKINLKRVTETVGGYIDINQTTFSGTPQTVKAYRTTTYTVGSEALSYAKENAEVTQLLYQNGATNS